MFFRNTMLLLIIPSLLISCSKEEHEVDELSYLKLEQRMQENKAIELKRTQIVSIQNSKNVSVLTLAFAKDKEVPKGAALTTRNDYAIRFTLHDSFNRSKTFGGGTFVLKLSNMGGNQLRVRNFQKTRDSLLTRYPAYSISDMDTILNPYIMDISNPSNGQCIVIGCKGTLSPRGANNNIYFIRITLLNANGEIWGIDHGYPNEDPETKEPYKILNSTHLGIEVTFPGYGKKASPVTYDANTLGTV